MAPLFVPVVLALSAPAPPGDPLALLETSCVKCHHPEKQRGGLDLTTREALLRGGDSGPVVVPRAPAESLLLRVVTHEDEPAMPQKADKLPDPAIAVIARWIAAGVPYDRALRAEAEAPHWAFRPLRTFPPGTTIDGLIEARLRAAGLSRAPRAEARALVRRASFALLGLPPAPEELDALVADARPDGFPRLVDRLLASPHYGERWARHWLDVARYADSNGYEADEDRRHAWPYRDFVIAAFNRDMPFDQFVKWQIAGDEYAPLDPEAWAATGFLAAGPWQAPNPTDTRENKERYRYEELDDIVSTIGAAFLGLTVGCARCHDHKTDPVTSRDYYQILAAFVTAQRKEVSLAPEVRAFEAFLERARTEHRERRMAALAVPDADRELLRERLNRNNPTQRRVYEAWGKALEITDEALRASLPPEARATWDGLAQAARAAEAGGPAPRALVVSDTRPDPLPAFLLARGEPAHKVAPVEFGFIGVVAGPRPAETYRQALLERDGAPRTTLRRAALAAWLTDVEVGAGRLVARVLANRVWQHHFGRGLVETPNDLGTQTAEPVQAELLDFLARTLIEAGWRLKPLHRAIMTSAVWQQGTHLDRRSAARDPREDLLWRRRPQRLEAEALRDALLAASGALDRTMFGPAIKPPIPREAMATRSSDAYPADTPDGPAVWRRSVYVFAKRSVRHPFLEVFDAPDASQSCGRRAHTTVPTQALALLNDGFVRARARDLAARVAREAGPHPARQVDRAFRIAFGRPPSAADRRAALAALGGARPAEALVDLCHALLTANEFAYVD